MKHGVITSTSTTDNGLPIATVQVQRAGVTHKNCPVVSSFSGEIQSIEEGAHVVIEKTNDGLMVVVGVISVESGRLPNDVSSQERVVSFDDGTEISVRKNANGNYNLDVNASGNVTINATGDVTIGDSANAVKLAVQNHTHDYDDSTISDTSDGTGTSSSTTKTTTKPKETGTTTLVE